MSKVILNGIMYRFEPFIGLVQETEDGERLLQEQIKRHESERNTMRLLMECRINGGKDMMTDDAKYERVSKLVDEVDKLKLDVAKLAEVKAVDLEEDELAKKMEWFLDEVKINGVSVDALYRKWKEKQEKVEKKVEYVLYSKLALGYGDEQYYNDKDIICNLLDYNGIKYAGEFGLGLDAEAEVHNFELYSASQERLAVGVFDILGYINTHAEFDQIVRENHRV